MKRFIGIDDGYDETKIVLDDGTCLKIPSQAKSGEQTTVMLKGGESRIFTYSTDAGKYTVGAIRESDPTAFDDYPLSPMNRVIVAHALRQAGITSDDEVICATGLPLKKFYKGGQLNEVLIKAKTENLLKNDVVCTDGYIPARIIQHEVLSEGVAAWMNFVIEEDEHGHLGFNEKYLDLRMAFVDIGGRTTDIAVVRGGELEMDRSDTVDIGMLKIKHDIAQAILEKYQTKVSTEQMRTVLETGQIKLWGQSHDVSDIVEEKMQENAQRIYSEVKNSLKDASDIDMVTFVGGSINRLGKFTTGWFKNQVIDEFPEYANAMGMNKFVRYLAQAGQ